MLNYTIDFALKGQEKQKTIFQKVCVHKRRKGNWVRIPSDPVTVSREYFLTHPLYNFLYEKERKICRSVSQETCLILKERLPKKVQFLTKCLMVFCICLIGCDGIQSIHAFPQAAADAMTSVLRACLREFFTNQEENPAAFLS